MTHQVAVVGGGPVGLTAALLLARRGVGSVVLEARPAWEPAGSRAICQQRDVLDVWDWVGAGAVAAEGLTWRTARTYHRDREVGSWSFADAGDSPLPPFVNIGQDRTEEVLGGCAGAEPLVELRRGCEVTGIGQDRDGVRLAYRDAAGGHGEVHAAYAVLACGAHSGGLRGQLGVGFPGESFADRFLICDVRTDLPGWTYERRFYFDPPWNPGRQVLVHPCPDAMFRIDWQVPPGFDLAAEEACGGLDRRIRQVIGERPYELVWRSVYRFHSRLADRLRAGRVLLAGDAAHLFAPFGARGLNSGVADAENAAWKLAAVLRGDAPEALLETYHLERHAAGLENLAVTSATMRFLVPQDEAARAHREAVLADPARRDEVDSGRFAEPFWYVDSPLTTPDPTRPFAGRPPKGRMPPPGPGVLVPDVRVGCPARPEVTRFRQLVREGFLVLVSGGFADLAPFRGVRVVRTSELVGGAGVAAALGAREDEAWVIRPDGHVAAVVAGPAGVPAVRAAVARALAAGSA